MLAACVHVNYLEGWIVQAGAVGDWLSTHAPVFGPFCWILSRVCVLNPTVPHRGDRGLYTLDRSVVRTLRECYVPPAA